MGMLHSSEKRRLSFLSSALTMPAAAVNGVVTWVLLALAVALSGTDKIPVILVYVFLCGIGFDFCGKPIMTRICHWSPDNEPVSAT